MVLHISFCTSKRSAWNCNHLLLKQNGLPPGILSLTFPLQVCQLQLAAFYGASMQAVCEVCEAHGLDSKLLAWFNFQNLGIQACADWLGRCEVLIAIFADL